MGVSSLSISDLSEAVIGDDATQRVADADVIVAQKEKRPSPIPEITAEIIRNMDNLCD